MPKREKHHPEESMAEAIPRDGADAVAPPVEASNDSGVAPEGSDPAALVATLRDEAAKNWDLYLRARADLENSRKRAQRDVEEANRYANDRLLKEMIPVLDNLERALTHAGPGGSEVQALVEGVTLTVNLFRKVLEGFGVKAVVAVGAVFDPNLHQAMGQVETADQPPNTVVTEFQKGYYLNDRLLRPALVMIAKSPAAE